ncbi:HAD family hydrolase [Robertmurraya sp. P23]|uniref:HAD family hydrolase n=1 Tax=Robertmurraya sp. P23 TaxID=3436931 RepID=UPI003D9822B8
MIKGVIFDMDGVLIDSEVVFRKNFHEFLKSNEVFVDISELNFLVGASVKVDTEYLSKKLNISLEEANHKRESYFKEITVEYEKIKKPYVNELLEYLSSKNIKVGLASSSKMENIQYVLEELGIKDYFSILVSGEMFVETKPNPEIYNYTVNSMNLLKEELLVVEDSNYGIEAAKAAGLKVAALIDSTFGFDIDSADFKIESLKDVIKIIEGLER